MQDLGIAAIVRAAWSERQLFEVMVDFWSNHLNVTNFHDSVWWSRHDYDRGVIRAHALGKFSDMLRASAKHPAMLTYLNNAESTKDNPNENYGRELLELHTVGLDAGYTEDEMRTSALILTGLGVHWYDDVDDGTFHYDAENHYTGSVKVLGWSSKNASASNGLTVALDYVDYLAHHPSTARRISTKLCQRFVSDTPPAALVDEMATAYRHNDTAIAPVLRVLFNSNAFHAAKGQKVLRPMQDVISDPADPRDRSGRQRRRRRHGRAVLADREHERRAPGLGDAERLPGRRGLVAVRRGHAQSMERASFARRRVERRPEDPRAAFVPAAREPAQHARCSGADPLAATRVPNARDRPSGRDLRVPG